MWNLEVFKSPFLAKKLSVHNHWEVHIQNDIVVDCQAQDQTNQKELAICLKWIQIEPAVLCGLIKSEHPWKGNKHHQYINKLMHNRQQNCWHIDLSTPFYFTFISFVLTDITCNYLHPFLPKECSVTVLRSFSYKQTTLNRRRRGGDLVNDSTTLPTKKNPSNTMCQLISKLIVNDFVHCRNWHVSGSPHYSYQ